ncbi:phosphotransferase [Streptomyces johnsoniae]|uniref:Phosphotransferase n=1 Tax=Streptomyces johnsoniae TaxID=3075532 RepID=A0ABU2SDF3_9ACTN|nr:phosphotransferase [Streptomyces sp. DSM 41886]MDT0447009.1 phosphotransferase [Streptomyces sp. DSM 41886]
MASPTSQVPVAAVGAVAARRTERAVRLATAAGRELGLRPKDPRVLYDVFNVLVHLAPEPVVVRVPSLVLSSAEEQGVKQRRELAVAGWLADTGAPVVRPSPLVPREPVVCEGTSMTCWEFVDEKYRLTVEEMAATGPERLAGRFAEGAGWAAGLHERLAAYPGADDLPMLTPLVPGTGTMLAELRKRPQFLTAADLDRAAAEYAAAEDFVADPAAYFPGVRLQPLHGDAPGYNVLRTADGYLFCDFEDATYGPVEWDLTQVGATGVEAYERASGVRLDRALLDLLEGARLLQTVGALALVPMMPELAAMLEPAIEQWRAREPLTVVRA